MCRERFSTLGISFTVSCFVKAKTEDFSCQSLQNRKRGWRKNNLSVRRSQACKKRGEAWRIQGGALQVDRADQGETGERLGGQAGEVVTTQVEVAERMEMRGRRCGSS